ncbi:MAG: phosphodiester glycosidase family protein [Clostridia bacterium]|nr:phosphodiester glycosidase family protein [Clostridia bacterium]
MRRLAILLLLLFLPLTALAEAPLPVYPYTFSGDEEIAVHENNTLWWRIESFTYEGAKCYLTKVWMADPGQQIGKATATWEKNVKPTDEIAEKAPKASLIINASGYVTRTYSWIPENYPGTSKDYYFTPLGSVTVTDGEVFRCLTGVPFYGLTLNTDGLRLHVGDDPEAVVAENPTQTWSFYVECPIIRDHESILDPEWKFTNSRAMRTIIARMDANNYIILTVTNRGKPSGGLTMAQCVTFLQEQLDPEWAYNLDGGPSSALFYRNEKGKLKKVWKPGQANVDIMTFSELAE